MDLLRSSVAAVTAVATPTPDNDEERQVLVQQLDEAVRAVLAEAAQYEEPKASEATWGLGNH